MFFRFFLYDNRTQKYDPKAHEKHPIHDAPYSYYSINNYKHYFNWL